MAGSRPKDSPGKGIENGRTDVVNAGPPGNGPASGWDSLPAAPGTPFQRVSSAGFGPENAGFNVMKAATQKSTRQTPDFYNSTLAPVHRPKESQFGIVEFVMLSVLFLETFVFVRLFIAN